MLDYEADHYCPAYRRVISADLCYESLCCLTGLFKISSTRELGEIDDIAAARIICKNCPYNDWSGDWLDRVGNTGSSL